MIGLIRSCGSCRETNIFKCILALVTTEPLISPPSPNQVHIWLTFTDEVRSATLLEAYRALLSPEETDRAARFRFDRDRHDYVVAHTLLRTSLASYLGRPPGRIAFALNPFGKPSLADPNEPLRFNLSHTRGLAVVAITRGGAVGVDAEDSGRTTNVSDAGRGFAPSEIAQLASWSGERQRVAFFSLWTLKEAYIKARGLGLSLPLNRFAFGLTPDGREVGGFSSEDDAGGPWFFGIVRPSDNYCVAVAAEQAAGVAMQLCVRQTVPPLRSSD
jgi:4'-phosphopantetheinyl transferase